MKNAIEDTIRQAALANPTIEVCGYVLRGPDNRPFVKVCDNRAEIPEKYFRLDAAEFLRLKDQVLSVFHSHPASNEQFSQADIAVMEELKLPGIVYSLVSDKFSYYQPCGFKPPLEGRMYVPLVFDCLTAVRDYIQRETGFCPPLFERTLENVFDGINCLETYAASNGFELVSMPPRKYDVLILQMGKARFPNHVAVYSGGGQIFHQVVNRISTFDVFNGYWERHTVACLRMPQIGANNGIS
jgi:proteasome lid subunit RPN8/RPN11